LYRSRNSSPNEATSVAIFLENLNEFRFKQLKLRIRNDFHQSGIEYPETIMDASKEHQIGNLKASILVSGYSIPD
jgi:hypothetical protein